ncbi:monosaccharide ABC transporter membrane protein, CUT2 family (TC 3.A.1.2.-) [Pseudoxanthobacter soli DSM 19599]|uniref:Monosaccharide ABC transporter membrane protein, CUT2 family (TC 3.A.1.2.-) n=1 Tax=Pseudoxanthobacter soli DSM 19599 TaxID=1123029 RepID=A0A1M7ZRA4_9HYPH|nr:ABC transporter permease [Pseudoxanthobacter soli]SHO67415.1 monosaccharide ABC transporter membrane protein, CUT2 family (TC 3.A.1.2.-) [Pseudoxanthobacter soli DSM 19599]
MNVEQSPARAPAPQASPADQRGPNASLRFLLSNEFGLIVLIVVFTVLFGLATKGFLSSFNLFTLGRTAAVNIVIGLSMMAVIVTGGLNLAVGAIGVCAAMTFGALIEVVGLPWPIALAGGLALGAALGAVNGIAVVRSGLHSFIITLATMSIFFGVMVFITRAESFRGLPQSFTMLGRMKLAGVISPLLIVAVAVSLALVVLYRLTPLGREMLAAGAKPEAAVLSGVRVDRVVVLCHLLSGLLASIAALMLVARNGAAIPAMAGQLGQDWLLPAFLGPVLGGTLLSGGRVSVLGTFLGALLVTMLTSGLLLLQIGEFWVQACLGILLLIAVLLDKARRLFLASRRMI